MALKCGIVGLPNVGKSSMFILYLSLIHFTFKDSIYAFPKSVKICYLILSIVIPITLIVSFTYAQWFAANELMLLQITRIVETVNTIILCVFASFLYSRILYLVSLEQMRHNDYDPEESEPRIGRMVHSIAKDTVLVLVVATSAIIKIVIDALTWAQITLGMKSDNWFSLRFKMYYIDCFICVFCLYLRYGFAARIYNKVCFCCHWCVMGCVGWDIRRRSLFTLPTVSLVLVKRDSSRDAETQAMVASAPVVDITEE